MNLGRGYWSWVQPINRGYSWLYIGSDLHIFTFSYFHIITSITLCNKMANNDISKRESVLSLADWYMRSHPGHNQWGNNAAIHNSIWCLRHPKQSPLDDEEVDWLKNKLNYRISMTKLATSYKNYMRISFVDCQDIDARTEFCDIVDGKDKEQAEHTRKCYELVCEPSRGLFDAATMDQGAPFGQMLPYMALALHSTNWTDDEMDAALIKCKRYKEEAWNIRRVITPLALIKYPAIQEMVSHLKDKKRTRDIDSDPVPAAPARKSRVPRAYLQGKDDLPITAPSSESKGCSGGLFDDSQG